MKDKKIILTMFLLLFLVVSFPFVSADWTWWNPFTWFDDESNVLNKQGAWYLDHIDGVQLDYFNTSIEQLGNGKAKICLLPKTQLRISDDIIQQSRATLFKNNVQTRIVEPSDMEVESEGGNVKKMCVNVDYSTEDAIRFGENSALFEYTNESIHATDYQGNSLGNLSLITDDFYYKNEKPHISTGFGNDTLTHTFYIENYSSLAITNLRTINLNNGEEVERNARVKYLDYYNQTLEVCTNALNYVCLEYQSNTFVHEIWRDLNSSSNGQNLIIGVFVDTLEGDYIDLDFDYYGVSVMDSPINWASWDSSLNTNLVNYWKLDDGNVTNVVDELGNADGTKLATQPVGASGKINGAYYFSGTQTINHTNTYSDINIRTSPLSINLWVYFTSADNYANFYSSGLDGAGGWGIVTRENDIVQVTKPGVNVDGCATGNNAILKNSWSMLTMVSWGNGTNEIWINGSRICTGTLTLDYNSGSSVAFIGSHAVNQVTKIDELAIWQRGLTGTEITTLYASGDGMSYEGDADPTVELGTPANETEYNSNSISVDFTCKGIDDINLDNLTFYLWNMSDDTLVYSSTNSSPVNDTNTTFTRTVTGGTNYSWNCLAYDNSSQSAFATNNWTVFVYPTPDNAPTVNLLSPVDNYNLTTSPFSLNFSCNASDNYQLDNVSLYINNILNQTNTSGVNATTYTFLIENFTEGVYTWSCEAVDNVSQATRPTARNFVVDFGSPPINITAPENGTIITQFNQSFNLEWEVTHPNIDTCWWSEGIEQSIVTSPTLGSGLGFCYTFSNNTYALGSGDVCTETEFPSGNNQIQPTVGLSNGWTVPQSTIPDCYNQKYNTKSRIDLVTNVGNYFCMLDGQNDIVLFKIISGSKLNGTYVVNNTKNVVTCQDNITALNFPITNPETYTVFIFANDTQGHIGSDNVTVVKSTDAPDITITSLVSNYGVIYPGDLIDLNWTSNNVTVLDTCIYSYNSVNNTIDCTNNTLNFAYVAGVNTLTIYANDTLGNSNSTTQTWTVQLTEYNRSFVTPTVEGSNNPFSVKVLTNESIRSVTLVYNGTEYLSSLASLGGNVYNASNTLTALSVDAVTNFAFYWSVELLSGTIINLTASNQTVNNILVDDCSTYGVVLINFTMYDEGTRTLIDNATENTSIKIDLNVYDTSKQLLVIDYYNEFTTNPATICLNESIGSTTLLMDAEVQYSSSERFAEFYNIRNYTLTTSTMYQNISLYDLKSIDGQEFVIIYKDENFKTVPNALIQIYRKYTQLGEYILVELPQNGGDGETVGHFIVNDAIYKLIFIDTDGTILATFDNVLAKCQNPSFTDCVINVNSFGSGATTDIYNGSGDFYSTLSFNKSTRTVSTSFVVSSGVNSEVTLNVTLWDNILGTSVCTDSIVATSGLLSCEIPAGYGNQTVRAVIIQDGVERRSGILSLQTTPSDLYGLNIMFLAMILLLLFIGMSINENPIFVGIFSIIGFILLIAVNLVYTQAWVGTSAAFILWLILTIVLIMIKGGNRN